MPSIRDSGEKTRTKDVFFALHPDFWGDFPDERRFLQSSSGDMGRDPGRTIHLGTVLSKKQSSCIEKRCKNVDFEHRSPLNSPKTVKVFSRHATSQAQAKAHTDMRPLRHKSSCASLQVSLAQLGLNRWRAYMPTVVPLANELSENVYAIYGVVITSESPACIFADRDDLTTDITQAKTIEKRTRSRRKDVKSRLTLSCRATDS